VRYGQDMTTEPTDPRPIMRRLWQMSGLDAPTVLGRAGVTEDDDPIRYSRLRRVLSGYLHGTAQEVGALLSALGLHPGARSGANTSGSICGGPMPMRWAFSPATMG
jgi:hypothetical protein